MNSQQRIVPIFNACVARTASVICSLIVSVAQGAIPFRESAVTMTFY